MPPLLSSALSSVRYIARAIGGYSIACDLMALVSVISAIVAPQSLSTRILLGVALVMILATPINAAVQNSRDDTQTTLLMGSASLARTMLVLGALAIQFGVGGQAQGLLTGTLICLLVMGEQATRWAVKSAAPQVANVPGWEVPLPSLAVANWLFGATTVGVVLFVMAACLEVTVAPAMIASLLGFAFAGIIGFQSVRYLYGRNRFEANLPRILGKLKPVFAFHWQAPAGTAYQASMWLPYLARLGVPYFVLVRTRANFVEAAKLTDAPIILRMGLEDLDPVVCPSLKVVFYANTAVRNSHMIRFPHLTHIQLNHGDSDKIASVSPTFRQYDRNFVAGQAAIDRFAKHGVLTRADQFVIVSRPQLETVHMAAAPISTVTTPTVLYSPTWSGFYEDSNYSSLPAGRRIVEALLARGCTVVFRPHPYSGRHKANAEACVDIIDLLAADAKATGRAHLFGPVAETEMSVVDCFNACHAMISDVSSVVSDFLISEKPFAMGAVSAHGEAFVAEFPLAEAAYVFDVVEGEAVGLETVLDDLLGADSKADARRALRSYYLSDTPTDKVAERFIEEARKFLV
jgi:CDP-glycerol:poly(glycerophosphate) glycerophosphotransferase